MSTKHKKRRLRRLIVAGMFAAALTAWAVPAAGAHPTGVYHGAVAPVVTQAHPTVNHALLNHTSSGDMPGFLLAHQNGSIQPFQLTQPVQVVAGSVNRSTGTGFAWLDAGIGAAVVLMTVALLGGAVQMTRTRRTIATP